MATQTAIANLAQTVAGLQAIDKERLLRNTLGEESLQQSGFAETLERIYKKARFASEYAERVDDNSVNNARSILEQLRSVLDTQAKRSNPEYVAQKPNLLNGVTSQLEALSQFWPPFVTAAVEARGFLEDEGIRQEYNRTVEDMRSQADTALKQVREESARTINEAKQLAKDIEERARRTAARISVEAAQQQFKDAQGPLHRDVRLWTVLSSVSIVAFIGVAAYLARIHLPEGMK